MNADAPVSHPIHRLFPTGPEGFDSLAELALDLRWSWSHEADRVWSELDPALWKLTYNPWAVLQTVSRPLTRRKNAKPGGDRRRTTSGSACGFRGRKLRRRGREF
jgi:starch phosphorylase